MGADVMRSVKHLLPDILEHMHVLLYQVRYGAAERDGIWPTCVGWDLAGQVGTFRATACACLC